MSALQLALMSSPTDSDKGAFEDPARVQELHPGLKMRTQGSIKIVVLTGQLAVLHWKFRL